MRVRAASALMLLALVACSRARHAGAAAALPSGAMSATSALTPPSRSAPTCVPGVSAPASFADLAAKANRAVVFVNTLQEQRGRSGARRVIGEGVGSGFVYDSSGLILTNNHVIAHASEISVTLGKARVMKATVVGRDAPTDVAVLRVDGHNLPSLPLGDSDAIRVGDWVLAIGNPFALSHTVSAGIISAKGRTRNDVRGLGNGSGYYDFLQTDASINPGNSGGPLLDMRGRVVGINTAIRAGANGIGFAIPINMVKDILPMLIKDGKVTRSAIGIRVSSLVPEDVTRLGLKSQAGAIVGSVEPGGPGDRAGLKKDDVIIGFGGHPIPSPEQLRWMASLAGVGKTVTLRVIRARRTFDVKVRLEQLPEAPKSAEAPRESP